MTLFTQILQQAGAEINWITELTTVAPVVSALLIFLYLLYQDNKQLKKELRGKDKIIQELNDKNREDALENNNLFRDTLATIKELTTELKIRNNE